MVPERVVVRLLTVLAAAAGCLDAVCVTRLDGMFASVVTGNLVQLGRAVATLDTRLLVAALTAVTGYGLGVAAGNVGLGRGGAGWRPRTSLVTAAECAVLTGVAAGWVVTRSHPDTVLTLLLLALTGVAMGVQSAVAISSGVPGSSTTYLTGTLTNLVRALTSTPLRFAAAAGGAARLAALLCGAVVGALLLRLAPLWAPALPAVLVGAVALVIGTASRARRH
ncbi:MAG: DUF1275 domain-containing protein [Pseudonocardia sp.]|nr:DUF1275 domain-containing protein [Pseudonocardia sp.]